MLRPNFVKTLFSIGEEEMPESLIRVQILFGKLLKFFKADLCRVNELIEVFKKVIQK